MARGRLEKNKRARESYQDGSNEQPRKKNPKRPKNGLLTDIQIQGKVITIANDDFRGIQKKITTLLIENKGLAAFEIYKEGMDMINYTIMSVLKKMVLYESRLINLQEACKINTPNNAEPNRNSIYNPEPTTNTLPLETNDQNHIRQNETSNIYCITLNKSLKEKNNNVHNNTDQLIRDENYRLWKGRGNLNMSVIGCGGRGIDANTWIFKKRVVLYINAYNEYAKEEGLEVNICLRDESFLKEIIEKAYQAETEFENVYPFDDEDFE